MTKEAAPPAGHGFQVTWQLVSILAVLLVPTLAGFMWIGQARSELLSHAARLGALEQQRAADHDGFAMILARLAAIDVKLDQMNRQQRP